MSVLKRLFGRNKTSAILTVDDMLDDNFRFLAIDVETANADTSSICQLGIACVPDSGRMLSFGLMIDPETAFDDFNTDLHGINARTVAGKPTFNQVLAELRAFMQRHPLVQHSGFDKGAIAGACKRYALPPLRANWYNSVTIARRAWPELRGKGGHGLANLKKFLDLDFHHHDAAEDARAAATVVLHAERATGRTFGDLAAPARRGSASFEKSIAVDGNQSGPLFGHVACFTGTLSLARAEAATIAASAGITVRTGVTKKTTLVIVGDQDLAALHGHTKSSKLRRAEELITGGQAIRILGETEFLALVGK